MTPTNHRDPTAPENRKAKALRFARKHWLALPILVFALLIAIWFALMAASNTRDFRRNPPTDPALEAWMTAGFVGMSYGLPRHKTQAVFALRDGPDGRETIGDISERLGLTLEELTSAIRAEAAEYRAQGGARDDD